MEIEILKGEGKEPNKESGKKECVYGIKELAHNLAEVQEVGYKLLAGDDLSEAEKDQLITVIASAKGGMKLTDKLLAEKSDVDESTHKKIDEKADAFLAGFEAKDKKE